MIFVIKKISEKLRIRDTKGKEKKLKGGGSIYVVT